jgi:hypothetical protein
MLQIFYELTPDVYVEMQTVRFAGWGVGQATEVGNAATGKLPFDDPGGTLDIIGWRKWRVVETTASPTLLASGRIMAREIKRGDGDRPSLRTGADRWWDCDAADQNVLLGARHFHTDAANRPAETAAQRLEWLLGTSTLVPFDNGHVTYPTYQLDANDYRLQTPADVLADCALPGGYNFFALQVQILPVIDIPELFFIHPDDSDWASTITISDDPADVDGVTVFAPSYDSSLRRTPERIASRVIVPYNDPNASSAFVTVNDDAIGDQFAYVDRLAPMANVHTSTQATVIANQHLDLSAEEDDRIVCSIEVPASQANDLRPFHRTTYKSTWMPGYENPTAVRVVQWAIAQLPNGRFRLDLELSPVSQIVEPGEGRYYLITGNNDSGDPPHGFGFDGILLPGTGFVDAGIGISDAWVDAVGGVYYHGRGGGGWHFYNFTAGGSHGGSFAFPGGYNVGNALLIGPVAAGTMTIYTVQYGSGVTYMLQEITPGPEPIPGVPGLVGSSVVTTIESAWLAGTDLTYIVPA